MGYIGALAAANELVAELPGLVSTVDEKGLEIVQLLRGTFGEDNDNVNEVCGEIAVFIQQLTTEINGRRDAWVNTLEETIGHLQNLGVRD
jgi:hypothetical protein